MLHYDRNENEDLLYFRIDILFRFLYVSSKSIQSLKEKKKRQHKEWNGNAIASTEHKKDVK